MTLWNGTNSFSVSIKEGPRIVKILRSFFSLYSESHQQKSFCKNKKSWSLEAPISSLVVYPLKAWESAGTHARHGLRPCLVPGAPPPLTLWLPPCPPTTTSGSSSSSTSPPNSPSSPQTSGPLPAPTFQPWAAVRFPNLLELKSCRSRPPVAGL